MSDDERRAAARAALAERLGHRFADARLFDLALAHPSYTRETDGDPLYSNERLEFLGDAVLQLVVSEWLYRAQPAWDEGQLTTTRSFIVRGPTLARVADELELGAALLLGRAAEQARGRQRASVLACGLEALIGAVFVDGGWDAARACVQRCLESVMAATCACPPRNPKGELQELTQERARRTPEYRLLETGGPAHDRWFTAEVLLGGEVLGQGRGGSKKEAEQAAARVALERLEAPAGATSAAVADSNRQ